MEIVRPVTRALATLAIALLAVGCSSGSKGDAPGVVVLVPGVAGDGSWYRNVAPALRDAGDRRTVEPFTWGVPGPGFVLNFNNEAIHARAERGLAERLVELRRQWPQSPIDVVAHSAGGGVTLGALAQLPADVRIDRVVLLNPSVSPSYRLDASLGHIAGPLHVFSSAKDTAFLKWRTSNFGTYDNVKTPAAGNAGFDVKALPAPLQARVVAHPYDDKADGSLGHDGGHFGALAKPYLAARVAPLIAAPAATPDQAVARKTTP